jgi:regulator of replication initiation timing
MASLVVSALSTWSNKGLKKAEKDVSAFDKTVKNLGKTFAGVFAASTVLNYSKNAVKAFMDDEKAAKALEVQLNNLGLSFAAPGVEMYIAKLQKTSGILDDQLRPAFQTLITSSGDLTASQKALAIALDVSAGTGKTVQEVSNALAKGFAGQTTGISRLNAGIDKNILATGDMNKIMEALNKKWSGQNAARLDTYAGKMSLLQVYAADAQETIGKGLIDALEILGKDRSIQSVGDSMANLADNIANVTTNLAKMIKTLTDVASNPAFQAVVALLLLRSGRVDLLAKGFAGAVVGGILTAPKQNISMEENRALAQKRIQDRIKEAKGIKTAVSYRVAENDALKKKTELDKLKDKFDVERIGLQTALNSATDEETKLRIKAQIAILDNNEALAKKYNAELEAANAAKRLADAADGAAKSLRNVYENAPNYGAFRELPSSISGVPLASGIPMGTTGGTVVQNNQFDFRAEGSILTDDDFVDKVQRTMQKIVTNGYITAPAGFL